MKRLLKLLLGKFYSKQEKADITALSSPSESATILASGKSSNDWTIVYTGIAPSDGYVTAVAKSNGSTGVIGINQNNTVATHSTSPWIGSVIQGYIPIKKGQSFTIGLSYMEDCYVRFVKRVGGGY